MLIIGIDLSLNSTGICFRYNGNSHYLSILNKRAFSSSKDEKITDKVIEDNEIIGLITNKNIRIDFFYKPPVKSVKTIGLIQWERTHFSNCMMYSERIYQSIVNEINKLYPNVNIKDIFICIENYSYGSFGDQTLQIVELTSLTKNLIISKFGIDNFFIVPAPSLKMWVGKGNYDKYQMLEAYTNNIKKDENLIYDKFYESLISKDISFFCKTRNKKDKVINEVQSPISDIIDSYFIALYMEKVISNDRINN